MKYIKIKDKDKLLKMFKSDIENGDITVYDDMNRTLFTIYAGSEFLRPSTVPAVRNNQFLVIYELTKKDLCEIYEV